jgi:UDP-N-acetylglucosamine pyrophosphorylase
VVQGVKGASMPPGIHKKAQKTSGALVNLKNANNAVFYSKVHNKIYSKDVFEDEMNLKIFDTKGDMELYMYKVSGVIYAAG